MKKTCDHLRILCPSIEEEVQLELQGVYWHHVYDFFHYLFVGSFFISLTSLVLFFIHDLSIWWFVSIIGFSASSVCMKMIADKLSSHALTKMHLRSIADYLERMDNENIKMLNRMIENHELNLTSEDLEWYYSCTLDQQYASERYKNIEKILRPVINNQIQQNMSNKTYLETFDDEIQRILQTENERRHKFIKYPNNF